MAYLWKYCEDGEYPAKPPIARSESLVSAILGGFYALWLIYAAGLDYLLMAVIFMTCGIPVFIWARKQQNPTGKAFSGRELFCAGLMVLLSVIALVLFARGSLTV